MGWLIVSHFERYQLIEGDAMRIQTKEYEVYTLNEVLEKAIERQWDINVDHDWWNYIYEDAQTIFELIGFEFADDKHPFFFSGFYSQGDGACIAKATYSYRKGALKSIMDYAPQDAELHSIVKEFSAVQAPAFYTISASIRHSGLYYHERSMDIDADCEKGAYDYKEFCETIVRLCRWLYGRLEAQYEYLTSREAIEETLRANDYEFHADGSIA